jgi:short-subunit dehydrogenase
VQLTGKTVLLTGATGGLGRAIATALAERGTSLVLSSRRGEDLERLAAALPGSGHRVVVADLADPGAAERLAAEAGGIDILVSNAGLPASGVLSGYTGEQIERAVRVNLEAPIRLTRAVLPAMQNRDAGHLVFISSITARAATAGQSIYVATKAGLRGFVLSLRQDLWGSGIGASLISPGFVREAGMFADTGAKPPPGMGTRPPQDVAAAVVSAIERDRGEVDVAPLGTRALVAIAHRHPRLAERISSRSAQRVAARIARTQTDKR